MKRFWISSIALVMGTATVAAQSFAPRETVAATLDGTKVAIEYGRPALGDRTLATLMKSLPGDRIWRTGSEQVTTLTIEGDVLIGKSRIPKGTYSLYLHCPENGAYQLVVNENLGQPLRNIAPSAPASVLDEPWPHFNYEAEIAEHEIARVALSREKADAFSERFTIRLTAQGSRGELTLTWGDETWTTSLATP